MEYKAAKKNHVKYDKSDQWSGISKNEFFTTGIYAIKLNNEIKSKLPAIVFDQKADVDICEMFVPESINEYKYECIYQVTKDKKLLDIVKLTNIDTDECLFIQRKYIDVILTYYPDAKPSGTDKNHAVLFYQSDALIGVIMPFLPSKNDGIEL